ncbi:hypothetical protein [Shewanella halotolerans]|uniref:hypothetical protein n=1 Tax=Shewanella halotolerans TaxID=2864204 RepID=UPI001C659385|nr:hypothetical protein [Shewanella halotolerans]QYJ89551.1 hypothetical protein K0H81_17550 [Shewanella halotolerans]
MNLESLYEEYVQAKSVKEKSAGHQAIQKVIGKVACNFPKDNPEALAWFTMALTHDSKKWFVAKLLEKVNPVPKALFDDLVFASLIENDPSFNKWFIAPCVRTFGVDAVKSRIMTFSVHPQVIENDGVTKVMYWIPRLAS